MKQITDNIWFDTFELDSNYILIKCIENNIYGKPYELFWVLTKNDFEKCAIDELQHSCNADVGIDTTGKCQYDILVKLFKCYQKHKLENQSFDHFIDEVNDSDDGLPDRVKNDPEFYNLFDLEE